MNKLVLWLGIVLTAGLPVYSFYLDGADADEILYLMLPGAAIAFLANFDRFSEITFGPVSARVAETLADAENTIEELKDLSLVLAQPQLTQLMAGNFGFADGLNFFRRHQLAEDICGQLRKLGISEDAIKLARNEYDRGLAQILVNEITFRFTRQTEPHKINKEEMERHNAVQSLLKLSDFKNKWETPTPFTIVSHLKQNGFSELDEDVVEALGAYEAFINSGKLGDLRSQLTHLRKS